MKATKKEMNPIPPTLRGKKRYVKFRFVSRSALRESEVKFSLHSSFARLFGEMGVAEQKLWLVKWFPEKNEGIVRCALEKEEHVKAGLLFMAEVRGEPIVPVIVAVSGSVKKLKG